MKILLLDWYYQFLDFALRCREAGHEVKWVVDHFDKNGHRIRIGDGFGFDQTSDWKRWMKWADIIILPTNMKHMVEVEGYRQRGYPIIGGCLEVVSWEKDRAKGLALFEKCGLESVDYHHFKGLSEAETFLRANPARWVSKPDNIDTKALSYVSKSAKDMLFMLQYWGKTSKLSESFIFQEFIPGIEVAVGGWFGPGGFSEWFLENFEFKKLMNGDIGCNTGEMGTAIKYVKNSALAEELLRPLEGELYRAGYCGYIDVAAMVAKNGVPYPMEPTCRMGWPAFQIQQALHPEPVQWMADMLEGRDSFKPAGDVAIGVVMAIGDFPHGHATGKEVTGYPLYGCEKVPAHNLHLQEVMVGEAPNDKLGADPCIVTAGDEVCVVSGNGPTVCAAKKAAYRNLKKIELPNSPIYRTDIGDRLEKQLPILQGQGWCEDWEYGEP